MKELRSGSLALKECVADLTLENRLLKKSMIGDGATEKMEIIRTVEGSHLPTKQTLDFLGIPRTTFYRPLSAMKLPAGQRDETVTSKVGLTACQIARRVPGLSGTTFHTPGGTI